MNTLNISIENGSVISRLNGQGSGTVLCSFISDSQVQKIIDSHNKSEELNPSKKNAIAVRRQQ